MLKNDKTLIYDLVTTAGPASFFLTWIFKSGLVALAVKLIPPTNSYDDLKTGVSSEDIVLGNLSPNNVNVSWIAGLVNLVLNSNNERS